MKNKMEETTKRALEPRLRFPEFRDAGEWEEKQLHLIAKSVSDKASDKNNDNILTLSGEHGLVLQSDYFGKKIAGDNVERYIRIALNDFVYNDRTTKLSVYGSIKRLSKYESGIVSPIYKCFRFGAGENPVFWDWYFESGFHETQLHSLVNEGARAGRFNISIEKFLSTLVWYPGPAEQQKIADCLSSIDELLAAEAQKLDTLKTHKKGLMQQLFPSEGETLPKLRFPDFGDAGEWCNDSLGEIFETTSGGTPSRSTKEYWNGNIPWITTSLVDFNVIYKSDEFISAKGLESSSAKVFPKGTVLIAMYGQGKTRGKVAILGIEAATNQACAAILPKKEIDPAFVFLNLGNRYDEMRELSNSGGQENLSQGLIRELPFSFPQDIAEQHKVADCLSSIDELLAAQTQKLDTLKAHKNGLMQQLFPSLDEVQG